MSRPYHLLTNEHADHLATEASDEERANALILSPHPESRCHYQVNCLDDDFFYDLEPHIGPYRAVHEEELDAFLAIAEDEFKYEALFEDAPIPARYEERDPGVKINSPLSTANENGFIPFQQREFNRLKNKQWGMAVWSTGTGKTVLLSALLQYHRDDYEAALVVVKRHNKVNTQRKVERLVGLDSINVTGPPKWRAKAYARAIEMLEAGEKPIIVVNYEKFRDDFVWQEEYTTEGGEDKIRYHLTEVGEALFRDRELFIGYDEMPMKLKNRGTHLYKSVCRCLYDSTPPQVRADKLVPRKTWQYLFSATPIEQDPEDVFNCVRLMDHGKTLGTVDKFRKRYVKSYNFFNPHQPEKWKDLDHMNLVLSNNMSRVDKRDPEIASMFPRVIEEPRYIEWNPEHWRVYNSMSKWIEERLEEEDAEDHILAALTVLQMFCDAPTMLNQSAKNREAFDAEMAEWLEDEEGKEPSARGAALALEAVEEFGQMVDEKHGKLEELKELLTVRHPGEKTTLFTVYGPMLLPILSEYLTEWGVSHVVYAGTDKQRQAAQDAFMTDPDIQVFLSSDAGSDSIDLEIANVSIDYDFPWNWSRIVQRRNRGNRVTSTYEVQYCYVLLMENSVEARRVKRVAMKLSYHEGVFLGIPEEELKSYRQDTGDLYYCLTGYDMVH